MARKKKPKRRSTYVDVQEDAETQLRNDRIRQRIAERQRELGLSDEALAKAMGTSKITVWRLKNRKMALSMKWLLRMPTPLGLSFEQLTSDVSAGDFVTVRVVGKVGAGAEVHNFDDRGDLGTIDFPAEKGVAGTVALVVEGSSMAPRYVKGQYLMYEPTAAGVPEDCIGRPCVVQTVDGRTLVKVVHRGTNGHYRLVSVNEPEVQDAELLWASRVRWTKEP